MPAISITDLGLRSTASSAAGRATLRLGLVRAMRKWVTVRPSRIRDAIKPSQGSQVTLGPAHPRPREVSVPVPELETKLESLRNDDRGTSSTGEETGAIRDIADEIQEVLNLPMPTLPDAIQLMLTTWRYGLEDTVPFRVLINRINKLLAENELGAGGDGEAKRSTLVEELAGTGFDSGGRRQEENNDSDSDPNLDAQSVEIHIEQDLEGDACSLPDTAPEGSDASSMIYSLYTVKSVTSINERTNWFWPPRERRGKVVP